MQLFELLSCQKHQVFHPKDFIVLSIFQGFCFLLGLFYFVSSFCVFTSADYCSQERFALFTGLQPLRSLSVVCHLRDLYILTGVECTL